MTFNYDGAQTILTYILSVIFINVVPMLLSINWIKILRERSS